MNHDFAHCQNEDCPLKESCGRYRLYLKDKKGEGHGWCSYADFKPDDKGECENYIAEGR